MDISALMPVIASQMNKNNQLSSPSAANDPQKVGQQFEALFYNLILSGMHESAANLNKDKMNSTQEDWAWTMMVQQLSNELARENNLKIGDIIKDTMIKK